MKDYVAATKVEQLKKTLHPEKGLFRGGLKGVEKESLRIGRQDGSLSQQLHPTSLGSPLTHPSITTDYAESLLELVTSTHQNAEEVIQELEELHEFFFENISEEMLWCSSMPCAFEREEVVRIAEYGTSNQGKMKHFYRHGLSHRYGKTMQTIAGIHYNFSFALHFWSYFKIFLQKQLQPDKDFISDCYFHLIRNFMKHAWIIPLLFGASPAICPTFLKGRPQHPELQVFDVPPTLYGPSATSLRMSDIGYTNNAQSGLCFSYENLHSYLRDLDTALKTPVQRYIDIGVKEIDGSGNVIYKQHNTNLLQIENEYYNPIRPKRVAESGERPAAALNRAGVQYLEVRSLDINPFLPVGVDATTLRFIDIFLIFCLFEDSPNIQASDYTHIRNNNRNVVWFGNHSETTLYDFRSGTEVPLVQYADAIFQQLKAIAKILDEDLNDKQPQSIAVDGTHHTNHNNHTTNNESNKSIQSTYVSSVDLQYEKLFDPSQRPSIAVLSAMRKQQIGFFRFAKNMSIQHADYLKSKPLRAEKRAELQRLAEESIAQQEEIENSDTLSFDEYCQRYFATPIVD